MSDLGSSIPDVAIDGTPLSSSQVAFPCGLIGKYFFNDEYTLWNSSNNENIPIDETNIAHQVDIEYKFKLPSGGDSIAWLNVTNEHVMVWFQMESFPSFIKLWGHIWTTLYANTNYTIMVQNNYDVSGFNGAKYIYLSEVNAFGGTNKFLGMAFLAMAGVVVLIMIVFVILYFARLHGKDLYSTENLQW
jgi:hypothetical protein